MSAPTRPSRFLPAALRSLLLPAALVALAAPAGAQTVLQPGHPDLMTDGLSLESHVEAVRIAAPAAQDIGVVRHRVTRDGDRVTLEATSDVPMMNQTGSVTTTFEWPSLRPVSRERAVETGGDRVAYDGMRVTGEYGRTSFDPLPFDITLQTTPFAPETLPILARALPFRDGYVATVPTFSASRRLRDVTLTVIGQESFTRNDGTAATTWVVEETSEGRGSRTQRYYVDAATRDLVAVSFEPQEGTTVVTEPTTEEMLAQVAANRAAGEALRPGSEALALDALESYSQDYVIKVVQPVQQDAGTQTRTVTVDRDAGTVTLQSEVEIAMAGQKTSETVVAAYPSLRPISSTSDNNGVVTDLTYSDTGVSRTRTPADAESPDYELTFEEPVFDSSFLLDVVRLLPFEEDYQAAFQTFSSDGLTAITLTVIGQDEIDGRAVWTVRAQPDEGPPTTFSVDAETRELTRVEIQPQVGVVVHFVPAEG